MSACTARSTRHGSARVPTSPSTSSSATIPGEFIQDSDIAHRRKFTTPGWKAKKQREADRNPVRKTRGCSAVDALVVAHRGQDQPDPGGGEEAHPGQVHHQVGRAGSGVFAKEARQ